MRTKHHFIRHLSASHAGSRIAAAHFERQVEIWDIATGQQVSEFDTILEFGGHRLAISPNGEWCVSAAYYVDGIACYSAESGSERWRRKDLKKCQYVAVSHDGQRIYCCFDERPCFMLDAFTGESRGSLRGVRAVYESPFQDVRLMDKGRPELQTTEGERIAVLDPAPSGFLTAAFGPETLCLSATGDRIRCYDTRSGKETGQYKPENDWRALEIEFSTERGQFVGVEWCYQRPGGFKKLVAVETDSGTTRTVTELVPDIAEAVFCGQGNRLLTSDGDLLDTVSGSVVRRLPVGKS